MTFLRGQNLPTFRRFRTNLQLSFLRFSLLIAVLAGTSLAAHAATVNVPAGGNFQSALNAAQPGDTIVLEAGASFTGAFTLPNKTGDAYITVQSSALAQLPENARVTPSVSVLMPKLLSSLNGDGALRTAAGAHHYRFVGIEFAKNTASSTPVYDLITLGDGSSAQNSLTQVPHHITLDRCYIHGDPGSELKRGVGLNSGETSITNSYIAEIKGQGYDTQAICGWNGPGPFHIINNYLEAAAENVLFGGADPSIQGLVPSDIEIVRNNISKPLAWRGSNWTIKNLLELKNARRVRIEGNVIENVWTAAQSGMAVVLTPRNQSGNAPWCEVSDVLFQNNIVRHTAGGLGLLATDDEHQSQPAHDIRVLNNLFYDIDAARWGDGSNRGALFALNGSGARNVTYAHNTGIHSGMGLACEANVSISNLTMTDNIMHMHILIDGMAGASALNRLAPGGWQVNHNTIMMDDSRSYWQTQYPTGNFFPGSFQEVNFTDQSSGNYRLAAASAYRSQATDGTDIGCNVDALNAAIAGTNAPAPSVTPAPLPTPQPSPTVAPTPAPTIFLASGSQSAGAILNAGKGTFGTVSVTTPEALGTDKRTRLMLFANGVSSTTNSTTTGISPASYVNTENGTLLNVANTVTVEARTSSGQTFQLPVEYAGPQGTNAGLDQVYVVLISELQNAGNVQLTLIKNGQRSNSAMIVVQ